jgi:hypothetical protein
MRHTQDLYRDRVGLRTFGLQGSPPSCPKRSRGFDHRESIHLARHQSQHQLGRSGWAFRGGTYRPWSPRRRVVRQPGAELQRRGEITEVGVGEKGLGERDWWLEYRRPLGSQEIFLGFTRYTFHGDEQIGGRSSSNNTTELSFGFQSKLTYLAPTLAAYWDVDRVYGLYIEASGAVPLLAWPYPPPVSLVLDAALGLNLGEDPHPGHPEELAYYAEDGFTHFQLGLSVDLHVAGSLTANGGARVHAGIDDAAKIGTSGQSRSLFVTFWLGATARWGKR